MLQCFDVFHIADMLANEGKVIPRQAEGVFLFGSTAQYLPTFKSERDRVGSVAAGAPGKLWRIVLHQHHAVVVTCVNIPVMHQEIIGDAA